MHHDRALPAVLEPGQGCEGPYGEHLYGLGSGHAYSRFTRAGDPDERWAGIIEGHWSPEGWCASAIAFAGLAWRPGQEAWTVESLDPLALSPSILCTACGAHGYIRNGRWEGPPALRPQGQEEASKMGNPVIDSVDFPSPVTVGQKFDLKVNAHDPDAETVSIAVTVTDAAGQQASFTGSLSKQDPLTFAVSFSPADITATPDAADPSLFHCQA